MKKTGHFFNCHISRIDRIINHVDNGEDGSARRTALDSAQVKQLHQTIRRNWSVTVAELLSSTRCNTSERTIQAYRPSIGYRVHESCSSKSTWMNTIDWNLLHSIMMLRAKNTFFEDEWSYNWFNEHKSDCLL